MAVQTNDTFKGHAKGQKCGLRVGKIVPSWVVSAFTDGSIIADKEEGPLLILPTHFHTQTKFYS